MSSVVYSDQRSAVSSSSKLVNFKDLIAWQKAHQLALQSYKLANTFPQEERFGLMSQIKRCSSSVGSNIAEGFSRPTSADKIRFYYMALGSSTELENQILLASDLNYISKSQQQSIIDLITDVQKLIHGMIKSLNSGKGVKK